MKKIMSIVIAMLLCISICTPVFAETTFIESTADDAVDEYGNGDKHLDLEGNYRITKSGNVDYFSLYGKGNICIIDKGVTFGANKQCWLGEDTTLVCCGDYLSVNRHDGTLNKGSMQLLKGAKLIVVKCIGGSCTFGDAASYSSIDSRTEYVNHYYIDGKCVGCGMSAPSHTEGTLVTSGEEIQALIDAANAGDELHLLIDDTPEDGDDGCIFQNPVKINKKLKINFEVNDYNSWPNGIDMKNKSSNLFIVEADNVELHFGDRVNLSGPQNNTVYGEAIYVDGNNCIIDGGLIHNCGKDNEAGEYNEYDGGAIYVNGKGCTISKVRFENCFGYCGGAICVYRGNCHVINCSFDMCEAVDYGGAIYVCSGTRGFVASHCTFSYCYSYDDYAHYISGAQNAKVFDCNPHWGEEDYYSKWVTFETSDPLANPSGFTLSEGNVWIIAGFGIVAIGTLAVVVAKKKKNPAPAEGEITVAENTEKTEE